jgi:type VI secretion system secreted protein VgrG
MVLSLSAASLAANATPLLGTAQNFAVLGGATVTDAGATTIQGDLGVSPGTAFGGMESIAVTGTVDAADASAIAAQADAASAFTSLAALSSTQSLTGENLGGMTLSPGVYRFSSAAQLTGDLTLDFAADPGGTFVFQIGSALTTAAGSTVAALNGSAASGVYWLIGSSATFGADTVLAGNVLAGQSITLGAGSSICGRAIALGGAVTMSGNFISGDCGSGAGAGRGDFGSLGFSGGAAVPEPATWPMMLAGAAFLGGALRMRRRVEPARRSAPLRVWEAGNTLSTGLVSARIRMMPSPTPNAGSTTVSW